MRFRILQGLRKDQIYFVLALGIGNGIYTWNSVLKEHIKECEKELQLNLITRSKNLLFNKFSQLGLVVIGGAFSVVGFTIFIQPWFKRRKAAKAEEFANFIYEQRKKRALE
ncbi:hypothetical protein ALC56_00277 [Trachymyrmex septentrionalis]|uniref:Uncharacterized protein n=1 Tax=Trachymyrmex septentrionalis TaxID=34720 RepID=A0A151K176_9HYME|nr:hypothetical protein ALC56_00277 [Trachymyrmex septentrionalis]